MTDRQSSDPVARVLVTDSYQNALDHLGTLINTHPEMNVVATAATAIDALARVAEHRPDIVIIDPYLPGADELDFCHEIHTINPEAACVIHAPSHHDPASLAGMSAAAAIVLKELRPAPLLATLERLIENPR